MNDLGGLVQFDGCRTFSATKKIPDHPLMIPSFPRPSQIKILIPTKASLILFFAWWCLFISSNEVSSMKVQPVHKKRTIETLINFNSNSSEQSSPPQTLMVATHQQNKLRRLPHVFSRVLELPLKSDADVRVEETSDCFRFVADSDGLCDDGDVWAHTIEIHPGVVKIVVRGSKNRELLQMNELELDTWRFRLPVSTVPKRASAVCVGGELVVTVPKGGDAVDAYRGRGRGGEIWEQAGRVVLVQ